MGKDGGKWVGKPLYRRDQSYGLAVCALTPPPPPPSPDCFCTVPKKSAGLWKSLSRGKKSDKGVALGCELLHGPSSIEQIIGASVLRQTIKRFLLCNRTDTLQTFFFLLSTCITNHWNKKANCFLKTSKMFLNWKGNDSSVAITPPTYFLECCFWYLWLIS